MGCAAGKPAISFLYEQILKTKRRLHAMEAAVR
jgi:hypothetical protein